MFPSLLLFSEDRKKGRVVVTASSSSVAADHADLGHSSLLLRCPKRPFLFYRFPRAVLEVFILYVVHNTAGKNSYRNPEYSSPKNIKSSLSLGGKKREINVPLTLAVFKRDIVRIHNVILIL